MRLRSSAHRASAVIATSALMAACALLPGRPAIRRVPAIEPAPDQMAEFWVEPTDLASRDLFWGAGGRERAPDPNGTWVFVSRKKRGFSSYSPGFDVKDERRIVWSAKLGDEAQSEVVASRLMWALGFHQPPVYYVPRWTLSGDTGWAGPQEPARFRPDLPEMKRAGDWAWHQSPFVDTQPWRAALVMMVILNNCDLKPNQNTVYELDRPREGARRWYVVRDLGLSLGDTGRQFPKRNDIETFERRGFVKGVKDGRVQFDYSGRYTYLVADLGPTDVKWTCERLARISPRQWDDVLRAAHYRPDVAARFIKKFQEKIAQGLAL